MNRAEALRLLRGGAKGVAKWNNRRAEGEAIPSLRGAELNDAHPPRRRAQRRADLINADLTGADLIKANLTGANLSDANLTHANLVSADLTHANLTGAPTSATPTSLTLIS